MLIAIAALFGLAAVAAPLTRRAGRAAGPLLALLPAALAARFGWTLLAAGGAAEAERWPWLPGQGFDLAFRADGLALLFALLITGIGAVVVVYAGAYLAGHAGRGAFMGWLVAFMASMLGLVLADDVIGVYVFWELTSVTSYMLIGFEHGKAQARAAALQALLVTAAGGLALLAGLLLLGRATGTWTLSEMLAGDPAALHADPLYTPIVLLIAFGAFTKSAQFPFHFWLPDAMAAPTPASAYLHSSTMVKAGVYLLARLNPLLGGTGTWAALLGAVGGVTFVLGAALALRETAFKRVLAQTTVSALGALVMLVGIGTPAALTAMVAFLLAHALYKAPLFLAAGAVDHGTGERDVERLGGLRRAMPATAAVAALAALSMAGVVPLAGYVAKEGIFAAALAAPAGAAALTTAAVVASAWLVTASAFVGLRPFFGPPVATPHAPHEAPAAMWLGPLLLAAVALVIGVAPSLLMDPLVAPAAAAIGARDAPTLTLWHGFGPALLCEAAALAAGLLCYRALGALRRGMGPVDAWLGRGAARAYDATLHGVLAFARAQTRLLQNGSHRRYMLVVVVTTVLLAGAVLVTQVDPVRPPAAWFRLPAHEMAIAGVVAVGALAAVFLRTRLAAITAMGAVGYGVALVFLFYGAPDLAMTQFVVETLTVILFVLVFHHLPTYTRGTRPRTRLRDAVVAVAGGALMATLTLAAGHRRAYPPISAFHEARSLPDGHGHNVVNVILVDFRALDTLGEITVLLVAGLGVHALLKLRRRRRRAAR